MQSQSTEAGMADQSREKSALVIVDVQNAFFEAPKPLYEAKRLLANLQALIVKARAANIPVIYVQTNGSGELEWMNSTPLWNIHADIAPAPGDLVIQKWSADIFEDTAMQQELGNRGIGRLVIAGCQTEYCINNSCRSGARLGYTVTLVRDGHATFDSEDLTAAQIVEKYSTELGAVVAVKDAKSISFA